MSRFTIGQEVKLRGASDKLFCITQLCGDYCVIESLGLPAVLRNEKDIQIDVRNGALARENNLLCVLRAKISRACWEAGISNKQVISTFLQTIQEKGLEIWQRVVLADLVVSLVRKKKSVTSSELTTLIGNIEFMTKLDTSILSNLAEKGELVELFRKCWGAGLNFTYMYLLINEFMSESGRENGEMKEILKQWLNNINGYDHLCDVRDKLMQVVNDYDNRKRSNVTDNRELPVLHINVDEKLDKASVKMPEGLFRLYKKTKGTDGADVKLIINDNYSDTIHVKWRHTVSYCTCNPYQLFIYFGTTADNSKIEIKKSKRGLYEPPKFNVNVGKESFIGNNPADIAVKMPRDLEEEFLRTKHDEQHPADIDFKFEDGKEISVRINLDNQLKILILDGIRICLLFDTSGAYESKIFIRRFDMQGKHELSEYAACIIDIFEDFLDDRCVQINNAEKEGDAEEANIYGSDYDELMEKITGTLEELLRDVK